MPRAWRLDAARARRRSAARPCREPQALAGRHVGLLFEKPSLRTRVTFTIGVGELGGDIVDIPSDVMHADREPLHDVARNLERWVDARGHPHLRPGAAVDLHRVGARPARRQRALGRGASVPGAGRHADAAERWGSVAGRTLAFVGDGNNVATSLVHAGLMLGAHVRVGDAEGLRAAGRGGRRRPSGSRSAAPSCRSSSIRARRSRAPTPSTPTSGRRWARRSRPPSAPRSSRATR